ncbi:MAG: hypothetical protein EA411_04440 [Saprospirales bacterium]|nr:MAG: hypothetical protein EA411_04440 [Saprospirales bacterium]
MTFLPKFNTAVEDFIPDLRKALNDNVNADFAVSFSELYMRDNFFYLFLGLAFEANYTKYFPEVAHIFEFEWCESNRVVYPQRVSASQFHWSRNMNLTI